ncbi:MAG: hypothetical protein HRT98_04475 [Mycoplasmatales bacterium]|nr:hypothetical protein [Mycoplasmatales bacterium]
MQRLKIKRKFWESIVYGKKQFEVRKLNKGITTGTYMFEMMEEDIKCETCGQMYDKHYNGNLGKFPNFKGQIWCETGKVFNENHIYGTAKLIPLAIFSAEAKDFPVINDKETRKFIKQHYEQRYDYVVYEIEEVEVIHEA